MSAFFIALLLVNLLMAVGLHSWKPFGAGVLTAIWLYISPYNVSTLGIVSGTFGLLAATAAAVISAYNAAISPDTDR